MTQQAATLWMGAKRVHQPVVCFCGFCAFSSMWKMNQQAAQPAISVQDDRHAHDVQLPMRLDSGFLGPCGVTD